MTPLVYYYNSKYIIDKNTHNQSYVKNSEALKITFAMRPRIYQILNASTPRTNFTAAAKSLDALGLVGLKLGDFVTSLFYIRLVLWICSFILTKRTWGSEKMDRRSFVILVAATSAVAGNAIAHPVERYDATVQPSELPQEFLPREVDIIQGFEPFEIHVVPQEFAMYWTLPDDRALRYTVGIGRPGLYEQGEFYVGALRKWPSWTPTPAMIRRQPDVYKQFEDGVPGGPGNPLGARGIYLYQPGRGDTMLRIHGTDEPETVGQAVSNGCARLVNDQLIEFYDRVPIGTRVVLYPTTGNFTLLPSNDEATL